MAPGLFSAGLPKNMHVKRTGLPGRRPRKPEFEFWGTLLSLCCLICRLALVVNRLLMWGIGHFFLQQCDLLLEIFFLAVNEKNRRTIHLFFSTRHLQEKPALFRRKPGYLHHRVPVVIFVANSEDIVLKQFLAGNDVRLCLAALQATHQKPGTGLTVHVNRVLGALG